MRVILGMPHLSIGPLLLSAKDLGAPIMVSAGALGKWRDEGPVLPGHEFNLLEKTIRHQTHDSRPPSAAQARRRQKTWTGWNTSALDRIAHLGLEIHLDSAGFVAMAMHGGYFWTPESYVEELCAHPAVSRFSSMDLCVEPEVAADRHEVEERIAKTVNLNHTCYRAAKHAGIENKFMPVIQGATAEDYIRCFERIAPVVQPGATVGVGSMCRRKTRGPDGSAAVLEYLDRNLPHDVRLHLFGLKSEGAEAAAIYGDRVDSVDSQAYGIRARKLANEHRMQNPSFSKTNVFVAKVMTDWYNGQMSRMKEPRPFAFQPEMAVDQASRPKTVIDAMERLARAQINDLIAEGQLDHDQIVGGRFLEEWTMEIAGNLPEGVTLTDRWEGTYQLPADIAHEHWVPADIAA